MIRPGLLFQSLTLLIAGVLAPGAHAGDVSIFAAASLKPALDEIAADPALQAKGISLTLTYAGSSALARQIRYGAPAQIFISANSQWMDVLEEDGLLTPDSRVDLLGNQLVLIAAPGVKDPVSDLGDLAGLVPDTYLAMGLVNAVPAGIYGREALQATGIWPQLQGRIVQSDNVRGALRLVSSGEAEYGIVYRTDPGAGTDVQIAAAIPAEHHSPIRYPLAMIGAPDADTRATYDLLLSEPVRAVFSTHGFEPLAGAE
jgi:molybdate transport system substrate-binding protein